MDNPYFSKYDTNPRKTGKTLLPNLDTSQLFKIPVINATSGSLEPHISIPPKRNHDWITDELANIPWQSTPTAPIPIESLDDLLDTKESIAETSIAQTSLFDHITTYNKHRLRPIIPIYPTLQGPGAHSTCTTFPQFRRLPQELQRLIWSFAAPTGLDDNGLRILALDRKRAPMKSWAAHNADRLVVLRRRTGLLVTSVSRFWQNCRQWWSEVDDTRVLLSNFLIYFGQLTHGKLPIS